MRRALAGNRWRTAAVAAAGVLAGFALATVLFARQSLLADPDTQDALAAVKRAIVAGHQAKDAAALGRLYADDYTAIDSKGAVRTKQQLLAGLETDSEIVEGQYELVAVRRWGSIAVASGHGHLVYRNPDGSTRVSDYNSVNVFEQRGGRWVYAAAFLP
jgi:ketosteroid isomerase-like protein